MNLKSWKSKNSRFSRRFNNNNIISSIKVCSMFMFECVCRILCRQLDTWNIDTWMVTYNDVKSFSQWYFRNDNSLQADLHLILANGLKVNLFRDCFVCCFIFSFSCYSRFSEGKLLLFVDIKHESLRSLQWHCKLYY